MHAAMIVSELLKPHLTEGATVKMADFMFRHKDDRDALARTKFVAQLNAMAVNADRARQRTVRGIAKRITRKSS